MVLRLKVEELTPINRLQREGANNLGGNRFVDVNTAFETTVQATLDHQRANPDCDDRTHLWAEQEKHQGCVRVDVMQQVSLLNGKEEAVLGDTQQRVTHCNSKHGIPFSWSPQYGYCSHRSKKTFVSLGYNCSFSQWAAENGSKCGDIIINERIRSMAEKRTVVQKNSRITGL